jgi:hypothetical protein
MILVDYDELQWDINQNEKEIWELTWNDGRILFCSICNRSQYA